MQFTTPPGAPIGASYVTLATNAVLTSERVLTGTTNQITVTDNGAGSTVVLSTPQNLHTATDFQVNTLTIKTAGTLLSGSTGTDPAFLVYPDGTGEGYAAWHTALGVGGSTTDTQTISTLIAKAGPDSVHGADYFNPIYRFSGLDTGGTVVSAYEMGTEGNVNTGTFSQQRWYLYQFSTTGGTGETIAYIDRDDLLKFKFSAPSASASGVSVQVGGNTVSAQADDWVWGLTVGPGTITKNNSNTRSFPFVRIKPTFNTGGSNANTTVPILEIDSTNTAVTGLTVIPVKVSYGGTELMRLTSGGNLGIGTAAPLVRFHMSSESAGIAAIDTYVGSNQGSGVIGRKARGTAAAPRRTKADDALSFLNARGATAVDDSTDAVFSASNSGLFRFVAVEDFTTSALGSRFELATITPATTTLVTRTVVNQTGLTIGSETEVAARGTTNPTNALNIYNGTAPVGTLTNGVTFYAASGEARVMDSAGNSTLLSPHDHDTNEWVFDSVLSTTGQRLRIDMERLMRKLDAMLGGGYIHEGAA